MHEDVSSIINTPDFRKLLKEAISEELARFVRDQEERAGKVSLIERMVRVEEALLALQREMNARFEVVDKRFEAVDKRFETVDKRFEALQREMDKRFEAMHVRFESLEKRLSFLQWFMAGGFTFLSILITIINFLK